MPADADILDAIGARLALISTANGYYSDIRKIERGRMTPWVGDDLPAINYWPTSIASERDVYGEDVRKLRVYVEIHARTMDRPFSDVAGELAADVATAVFRLPSAPQVSAAADPCLSGSVSACRFMGYTYQIGKGQAPWCGALVEFEIEFRAEPGDMENYTV